MSKEQVVDTARVWERLYPVRRQCHWTLPVVIGGAVLIALGMLLQFVSR
jgi:hypothetical protein